MDISKYFNKNIYIFGDIISLFINDLYNENKYTNILFIRTCTTGGWLDNLLIKYKNVTRILYYNDTIKKPIMSHKLTKKI